MLVNQKASLWRIGRGKQRYSFAVQARFTSKLWIMLTVLFGAGFMPGRDSFYALLRQHRLGFLLSSLYNFPLKMQGVNRKIFQTLFRDPDNRLFAERCGIIKSTWPTPAPGSGHVLLLFRLEEHIILPTILCALFFQPIAPK